MDSDRFDTLVHALTGARSRRELAAILGAFGLAVLPGHTGVVDAKGKKKKKKKKKKSPTASPPTSPLAPAATCSDGIRNGSESDVDCGGSCVRCLNGKACATRNDCAGAFCANNTCQECTSSGQCGNDIGGAPCVCEQTVNGPRTCNKGGLAFAEPPTCGECPPGTHCISAGPPAFCVKPCGAP